MKRFLFSASAFVFAAACMLPALAATPDAAVVPQDGMPVALDACRVTAKYGSDNPDNFKTNPAYWTRFYFSTDLRNVSSKDIFELSVAFLVRGQTGYTRVIDRIEIPYAANAVDKDVIGLEQIPGHVEVKRAWCTLGSVVFADGTEWTSSPSVFQRIMAPPAGRPRNEERSPFRSEP